ncbi:hypothetical protein G0U57_014674, partial [Chelydra serpentina]
RRRILRTWMKKRQEKRMKMEMRMGRRRTDMQQNDLQRKKRRMKLIQRDRRQKMGLRLEFSLPILFCSICLSSLHSSLCLHCHLASGFTQSQMRKD